MSDDPSADHAHDESEAEKLDRNLIELLNELRVTGTGIQVLFAFLLVVPFNAGYRRMSEFDKVVYFVALGCIAVATVLLIAPSIHHRLLFRQRQRAFIVQTANVLAIVAMGFLAVGLIAIVVLIGNVVFGSAAAVTAGAVCAAVVGGLWFVVPLTRRAAEE